jgi:ACT domain-containing protein
VEKSRRSRKADDGPARIQRLLWLIQEIRNDPHQEFNALLRRAGISRSQFYKDRTTLAEFGFFSNTARAGDSVSLKTGFHPFSISAFQIAFS